jgi:hypothetical protein
LLRRLILLRAVPAALLLVPLISLLIAGCGEREFEPGEFVDAANEEGAGLVLGDSLTSITEDVEVYALAFEEADEPAGSGGHEHGGGGSLLVAGDAESAAGEYERCEETVSLTCYRAANVVLYFNAAPSDEHVAKVDAAIRALGDE